MADFVNNEQYEYLRSRDVKYLVHFTPVENFEGILRHGICPRRFMDNHIIHYTPTDEYRSDAKLGYTCFSLTMPNRGMMIRKMYEMNKSFVELFIDIEVIRSIDSARIIYSQSNAAKSGVRWGNGIEYLDTMFSDEITDKDMVTHTRKSLGIPENFATDPQAEVLIHCIIPPKFIKYCRYVPFDGEEMSWVSYVAKNYDCDIRCFNDSISSYHNEVLDRWWGLKTFV